MIADYLDRDYVLAETRAHRDWLAALQKKVLNKDKEALAALRKHKITQTQLARVVEALDVALARAKKDKNHPQGSPYIPSDPVTCGLQTGMTQIAMESGQVRANSPAPLAKSGGRMRRPASKAIDTSPPLRLRRRVGDKASDSDDAVRAPFVEGEDLLYGLEGFKAKFGALFTERRPFNTNPARIAKSTKPLSLFVFGDWGTGLSLADKVTQRIREQIAAADGLTPHHKSGLRHG